ncbi:MULTISPECIES: DUF4955 domain-containing protein [Cobetia]|uniref:DUF4955 domain-containing protein n=1 Tax=Cobetia TaxID=204286 RepID=UPI0015815F12|nr:MULTISPECIES: DUF4955 domain-containing protein [Cobetia]MDI4660793.1 DUF4955 domain-containing protein [Cobetia sp. BMC6]NUJ56751.1 DUF4955 domain-containing protein [Cobetia marina]
MSSSRSPHRSSADSASKGALNGDSPSPGRKNRRRLWTGVTGLSIACVVVLGWWAGTPLATLDATTPDQQVGNGETEDAGQSTLWQQYQLQWQANQTRPAEARKPLPLPDVSRAGYHQGEALPALALEPHDAGEAPGKGEAEKVTPDESEKGALRRFDVTAYGADGSDTLSDRRAILKAHAAMRDWQRQGSDDADRPARRGVLYFPAGEYVVYGAAERDWFYARLVALKAAVADSERQQALREALLKMQGLSLAGSHWTLMGAGSDVTHLRQTRPMLPLHASWYWSTPWLLHLGNLAEGGKQEAWQAVTPTSHRQPADTQDTITLADETDESDDAALAPGDEVLLESIDKRPEAVARALAPYQMEKDASTGESRWLIERDGVFKRARYRVVARDGHRLTLSLPVVHERFPGEQWRIARLHPAREVGVQGITLKGNWRGHFKHHRSAEDDSGFGLLDLDGITDGWVRDVRLDSFNQGVKVRHSSQLTLEDVTMTGKPGHIAMTISDSNQVLARQVVDQSHAWHAPGVARYATHNVYLELEHAGDSGIELHGQQSRDNVFDQKRGGHVRDRWGASVGHQPNHLRGLVLWNPVNTGKPHAAWPFMRADSHFGKVIMPTVVGATGHALGIANRHDYARVMNAKGVTEYDPLPPMDALQARVESPGEAVKPASLYRAQRELLHETQE